MWDWPGASSIDVDWFLENGTESVLSLMILIGSEIVILIQFNIQ